MTEFIYIFQQNYPGQLPLSINYVPLLCYVGGGFIAISFLIFVRNSMRGKARELKSEKKFTASGIYKTALFITIFIFAFMPLTLPIFDRGLNNHNFSVYNNDWNGASKFKNLLETNNYETYCIQSSLSVTERIENKSILLTLMGPNQYYNPIFEIPYFVEFFQGQNSLLICHDHGSTAMLLWEIFFANLFNMIGNETALTQTIPVTIFADGLLYDNESFDTNPKFPVIRDLEAHPTTNGISQVILSRASAVAGGPLIDFFGWDVIGRSSDRYSYVDKNGDGVYRYEDDYVDISFITSSIPNFPENMSKLPLGYPFTPTVFMATESGDTRVFLTSDASMFNNELLNNPDYDNEQFALNIINWLTHGNTDDWIIAFDEAHIRPEFTRDLSSAGIFGYIIQYIVHLSTNPITAWIYPLLAVYTLKKYLPKKEKDKEKQKEQEEKEELIKFRTSSFFAKKIKEYREKGQYRKAILLLYRRVERKLHAQLGDQKITPRNVEDLIRAKEQKVNKSKIKRITRFIGIIEDLKKGKENLRDEIDFENLFYEMEWAVNNI
ncbi:MAG: hypothetical protein EU550_02225 [Promethearchaeota archaeon]|nr:MAG: hypothetical protein EU550_02225 [Candidatus Lokiarchaeota archaeon]